MQGSSDNGFPLKQLINGEWQDAIGGGTWDLIDPGSEDLVTQVPYGDGADATAAIDAAAAAFPEWSAKTAYERAKVLERASGWIKKNVDELARLTTEESGKPLQDSKNK